MGDDRGAVVEELALRDVPGDVDVVGLYPERLGLAVRPDRRDDGRSEFADGLDDGGQDGVVAEDGAERDVDEGIGGGAVTQSGRSSSPVANTPGRSGWVAGMCGRSAGCRLDG